MANVIFKRGTRDIFDALEVKNADTLYWLTDTQELYQGDKLFGVGREATAEAAGLLSAKDKAKLDALVAGTVSGLTPVDASIIIGDGENGEKTIKVGLSAVEGNILTVQDDGLYASAESVEQIATDAANEAINEFASQVSDDGTVNTIKELIDYVAEHAPEAADMAADMVYCRPLLAVCLTPYSAKLLMCSVPKQPTLLKLGSLQSRKMAPTPPLCSMAFLRLYLLVRA